MEKTRELAVVTQPDINHWSGRHTRLRYQMVLTSLVFLMASFYGIKEVEIPGVLTFAENPPNHVVLSGLFLFYIFSLVSFWFQHIHERRLAYFSKTSLMSQSDALKVISDKLKRTIFDNWHLVTTLTEIESNDAFEVPDLEKVRQRVFSLSANNSFAIQEKVKQMRKYLVELQDVLDNRGEFQRIFPSASSNATSAIQYGEKLLSKCNEFEKIASNLAKNSNQENKFHGLHIERLSNILPDIENFAKQTVIFCESLNLDVESHNISRSIHLTLLPFAGPIVISVAFVLFGIVHLDFLKLCCR